MKGKIKYIVAYYIIISAILIGGLVSGYSVVDSGVYGDFDCFTITTYSFFGIILYSKSYNEAWNLARYNEYNTVAILILVLLFLIAYLLPIIVIFVQNVHNNKALDKSQREDK